jgi:hypothetical protein
MPQRDEQAITREREKVHEGRTFALTIAVGFAVIGVLALRKSRHTLATVMLTVAGLAVLCGLLIPGRLGPLRSAWMKLGELMSHVTTPLIMGALYYLVFAPIAVVRRARRERDNSAGWRQRPPLPSREQLERQF